jgi:hypothetical protein
MRSVAMYFQVAGFDRFGYLPSRNLKRFGRARGAQSDGEKPSAALIGHGIANTRTRVLLQIAKA